MVDMDALADAVSQAIEMATAPLAARIAVLEQAKSIEPDLDGLAVKAAALIPVPRDGRDAGPVDVDAIVAKVAALIPAPRDGRDGKDGAAGERGAEGQPGRNAEPVDLDLVATKAAALVPRPADGRDGRDGASLADLVPVIQGEVTKAISAIPLPKDGRDGAPGPQGDPGPAGERGPEGPSGRDGRDGSAGPQGERGQDGRDGKDGQAGESGARGEQGLPGERGEPGERGTDGADGVGFDDMDLVVDETQKTVHLRFTRGDVVKQWAIPMLLDAGVYADDQTYRKGHLVTRGGSVWIALRDGISRVAPGDGTPESVKAWRLAVSRGKEGKQGKSGPQGAPGRDLRWEDRDG